MLQLLTTIKSMTQGRERRHLEAVLAKGMQVLLGTNSVRIYKLEEVAGARHAWLAVEVDQDITNSYDNGMSVPEELLCLSDLPLIEACVKTCEVQATEAETLLPVITSDSRFFGVVAVSCSALSDEKLQLAAALLDIFKNFVSVLDYSEIDTLTGLLNRKTFDDYLGRILTSLFSGDADRKTLPGLPVRRRAPAPDHNHWLAVIDIDHFKRVNDNFGHSIGDEVLLLVASMMKACFRSHDKLFRFGGEEFVVILKPTTAIEALGAFERFRCAIENRRFPLVDRISLSIGFSQIRVADQPSIILGRADQALYWVKANGRNQVCNYESLVESGALTRKEDKPDVEFY